MSNDVPPEYAAIVSLMAQFNLDPPTDITRIKHGIANHNYAVTTAQGQYVVKFLIAQQPNSIANDMAVHEQLGRIGIVTPAYICDPTGSYVFNDARHKAVISPRLEGTTPRQASVLLAHQCGSVLAQFHTHITYLPQITRASLLSPLMSRVETLVFSRSLPQGFIHGDFHLGNILANGDQLTALLDFEEVHLNLFVVDIAIMVLSACATADEVHLEPVLVQACLEGYQAIRPLTEQERIWFAEAVHYAAHTWIKWFNEHGYAPYAVRQQDRLYSFNQLSLWG